MARKKTYIKSHTFRDKQFLVGLSKVGYMTKEQANHFITDNRLKNFGLEKVIEKVHFYDKETKQTIDVYRLTDSGFNYCVRNFPDALNSSSNRYSSPSVKHDLALADRYIALDTWEERKSWQTEGDSRDAFNRHLDSLKDRGEIERYNELYRMLEDKLITMPDAVVTMEDGSVVAVEIVTKYYNDEMIEAKEEFCKAMGTSLSIYKT